MIKKGETYRLSYGVLIHDQPAKAELDRKAVYESLARQLAPAD
jgi:hypothetical protein